MSRATESSNIKVVCRFRPMNKMEKDARSEESINISSDNLTVQMKSAQSLAGPEKEGFSFDRVFGTTSGQEDIFDFGVKDIVQDVMTGFNGTLFCYGQTGSGKTFTMMGADIENPELKGLIPRITEQIFASILSADSSIEYTVKVSYMEIYMEKIKDLLAPANDNLSIHEDKARGVYIKGLTDVYVGSEAEVFNVMKAGGASRAVSSTNMNAESSRSHSIFVIGIHQRNTETGSQKSGHLYLVDLAGSEKVGKTGASGQTLEEAKKINKSLSALGMVINSLTDGKSTHIPYRDSKLTRILQESLGGNSRTTLIINCSPATFNEPETLSTLRFGMRAKSIKNKARINVELSPAELKSKLSKTTGELASLREFVACLEEEVNIWRSGGKVDSADWAKSGQPSSLARKLGAGISPIPTPSDSRPDTPSFSVMDKDEREEFLRRENELSDQLAEKESALASKEKLLVDLKEEMAFLREQESSWKKENDTMAHELSDLRIASARLESEAKDTSITLDSYKDKVGELQRDIEEQKVQIEDLKKVQAREKEEEKEKRKQEMLNDMMSKIDMGGTQLDAANDKLRQALKELDNVSGNEQQSKVSSNMRELIREHMAVNQEQFRELQERIRSHQEEAELQTKRANEVEKLLSERDTAYEELLKKSGGVSVDEVKSQLDAAFSAKEQMLRSELSAANQRYESSAAENRRLHGNIESYRQSYEEVNRALTVASRGVEDGETFANATRELERNRKQYEAQYAEFEIIKKNLMKDLQNRCEKVVELEMQLDEVREQYKVIARSANSRAQQRKLEFLEHNLDALNDVQKQLVEQNSSLKKEVGIAERKLIARNERIQNLESLLNDADARLAQKNQRYEQQLQAVRERLADVQSQQQTSYNHARIAKPLRGGGGASQPAVNVFSSNPLTRAQEESAASAKRRESQGLTELTPESWFFSSPTAAR